MDIGNSVVLNKMSKIKIFLLLVLLFITFFIPFFHSGLRPKNISFEYKEYANKIKHLSKLLVKGENNKTDGKNSRPFNYRIGSK